MRRLKINIELPFLKLDGGQPCYVMPKYERKQTFAGDMNVCYHLIQRQASDKNELVQLNPTAILISKK